MSEQAERNLDGMRRGGKVKTPSGSPVKGMRYLIFSEEMGVFLGDGKWSREGHRKIDRAPTFEAEDDVTNILTDPVFPQDAKVVHVFADLTDGKGGKEKVCASVMAVIGVGLPPWDTN